MIYKLNLKLQSIFSLSQQRKLSKINKQHKKTGRELDFLEEVWKLLTLFSKPAQRLENNTERKKIN